MSQHARQRSLQPSTPARGVGQRHQDAEVSNAAAAEALPEQQGEGGSSTLAMFAMLGLGQAPPPSGADDDLAGAKHEAGDYGPSELGGAGVEDGFLWGAFQGMERDANGEVRKAWSDHRDAKDAQANKQLAFDNANVPYLPLKRIQDDKAASLEQARAEQRRSLADKDAELQRRTQEREDAERQAQMYSATVNPAAHRTMQDMVDEAIRREDDARQERSRTRQDHESRVQRATAEHDTAKRNADDNKPASSFSDELDDARESTRNADKKRWGMNTSDLKSDNPDETVRGKETNVYGFGRAGHRASIEKESIDLDDFEFDRSVSAGMGGSEIEMRGGFQGDIAGMEQKEASLAKAGAGEGADGVFFESTRGKGETGANAQAYVGNAAAKSKSMSQGGDWLEGDLIGAHAQAAARAGLLGASASANAAAEGGPALGGIDPVTGKRRGMLSAEAGADADVRAMEVGAEADSQAYVQGTRAGAAANASADASLIKASGGANAGAGIELGGVKLAAAEAAAEGSANVGARGSMGAAAEIGLSGIKAKANAETFAGAEAEGSAKVGGTLLGVENKVEANGRAMAGAEADGEVGGSLDLASGDAFVKAEGEAFAGAKAEGAIGGGIGLGGMDLVTVDLEGSLRAGIGIGASFLAGMVDAALEFFAEANLTFGAGLGAGIGLNVGIFTPVNFVFQTLEENGVISADPDDWIGQFVTLCQTGKVLRSDQQGLAEFAPSELAPPATGGVAGADGVGAPPAAPGGIAPGGPAPAGPAPAGPAPDPAGPVLCEPAQEDLEVDAPLPEHSVAMVDQPESLQLPLTEDGVAMLEEPESLQLDGIHAVADKEPAMEELAEEIDLVSASLEEELAPVMDIEQRWKDNFQDDASTLVDSLVGPMADLWDLIDTALSGVFSLLTGDLDGVMAAGAELVEQAGALIDGAGELLAQALTDPVGAIESFFSRFDGLRAIAEGVLTMATGGIAALQAFFEGEIGPAQAISGMIRGMADGVLDILVGHGEEAADDVREIGGATDEILDEPVDEEHLGDAALTLAPGAREAIDEEADIIEDAGPEAVDLLMEGIDGAAEHVDGYIDGAVEHVAEAIDGALGVVDDAAQIPGQVADDVFNIKDGLIVRAMQLIAERIAEAARAFWAFFGW